MYYVLNSYFIFCKYIIYHSCYFIDRTDGTPEQNSAALADDAKAFGLSSLVIATTQFIAGVLSVHSLNWSANRQVNFGLL